MSKRKTFKTRTLTGRYEFTHGRPGLALLYGLALGIILSIPLMSIFLSIIEGIPFLYRLSEESDVFTVITVLIAISPMSLPIVFMIRPPKLLRINIKCIGILHEDYAEIHKGRRVIKQRYEKIKRVIKFVPPRGGHTTWIIGRVWITEPVGVQKGVGNPNRQIESFSGAVRNRVGKSYAKRDK